MKYKTRWRVQEEFVFDDGRCLPRVIGKPLDYNPMDEIARLKFEHDKRLSSMEKALNQHDVTLAKVTSC